MNVENTPIGGICNDSTDVSKLLNKLAIQQFLQSKKWKPVGTREQVNKHTKRFYTLVTQRLMEILGVF